MTFTLESTRWKERTDFWKLSYDFHTRITECLWSQYHGQLCLSLSLFYSWCDLSGWILCSRLTHRCRSHFKTQVGKNLLFSSCRWLLAGFSFLQAIRLGSQLVSSCSPEIFWNFLEYIFLHRAAVFVKASVGKGHLLWERKLKSQVTMSQMWQCILVPILVESSQQIWVWRAFETNSGTVEWTLMGSPSYQKL